MVRAGLGARGVSWPQLVAAVLIGTALSATALMLIDMRTPIEDQLRAFEEHQDELTNLALPFQVIATMLTVILELRWIARRGGAASAPCGRWLRCGGASAPRCVPRTSPASCSGTGSRRRSG